MNFPLMQPATLPLFSQLRVEEFEPLIRRIIEENEQKIEQLAQLGEQTSWDNFVAPLEDLHNRLERAWSPVRHLHSVADSESLRAAYNVCLPLITHYYNAVSQHPGLYAGYRALHDRAEFAALDAAQQQAVHYALREFHLSGVDLPASGQARYRDLSQRIAALEAQFGENVQDCVHAWKKWVKEEAQLAGVPATTKELLREQARRENIEGWLLTLDLPAYLPVLQHAHDRALRQEIYTAYATRAASAGPHDPRWDNTAVIQELLALRHARAALLGFANHAEYALAKNMAETPRQVLDFLCDLARRAYPHGRRELAELAEFAAQRGLSGELEAWDIPYYAEALRQERHDLNREVLRPYFPAPQVLAGLFTIFQRLFAVRLHAIDHADTWHEEVRLYELRGAQEQILGWCYVDLYARKHKRGGAWMDEYCARKKDDHGVQLPVAYVNCNFPPPSNDAPALLTHEHVVTLFHEFGHAMHHLLTEVNVLSMSGIHGMPWDAVELPSQCLENWCWQPEALELFAHHYQTGEPLPKVMLDNLLNAKNFHAGMYLLRQLEFALFDMRLHTEFTPDREDGDFVQRIMDETRAEVAVVRYPAYNRMQNSFSHIFSGGYSAGYYSYLWANVLAADVFAAFEEEGVFNRATGERYVRAILSVGGACAPLEAFQTFRGRPPEFGALLRRLGLEG